MAKVDGISDGNIAKANWLLEPIREPMHKYLYLAIASALLSWGADVIRSLSAASFVTRSIITRLSQAGELATPGSIFSALRSFLYEMKLSNIVQNPS